MNLSAQFRLLAWSMLERAFATLRALPFEYNARAGVLRISGEPFVVPRQWLASDDEDAQRSLAQALQRVWDVLTDRPLRIDGNDDGTMFLQIWRYRVSVWRLAEDAGEFLDEGSQTPGSEDACETLICEFVMPGLTPGHEHIWTWDHFGVRPDMEAELPALLRHVVAAELRGVAQTGEGRDEVLAGFSSDLSTFFADELLRHLPLKAWQEAVILLAGSEYRLIDSVYLFGPRDGGLLGLGVPFSGADFVPPAGGKPAGHLEAFLEHAVLADPALLSETWIHLCARVPATTIAAWLRANGLSRKGLARLCWLPVQALNDFADEYALQLPGGCHHGMDWLNRLLSAVWLRRDRVLEEADLRAAAEVATLAGVFFDRLAQRQLPRWQGDCRHAVIAELDIPQGLTHDRIARTMNLLFTHGTASVEAYATTLMHTLLGDGGIAREEVHAALQDIHDWVYGVTCSEQHLRETLTPARLGPGWAQLLRGQQRWHDAFAQRCAGLPPEIQRQIDAGLALRPGGAAADASGPGGAIGTAWDPLCPAFVAGDLEVLPLASTAALLEEGERMQHCVGNYTHECVFRGNRVFSLRYAFDGESVATAQFAPGHDGWRLVQLRGFRNAPLVTRSGHVHVAYVDIIETLRTRLAPCRPFRSARAA